MADTEWKVVGRHVRRSLLRAVPPQLTAILHLKHAAVGVVQSNLPTEETQYGHLTNITIHYMFGREGGGRGRGGE